MRTLTLLACLLALNASAQYNFGFEEYAPGGEKLAGWNVKNGPSYYGPLFGIDTAEKHGGRQSFSIERRVTDTSTKFTPISIGIPVDFNGEKLELGGWLRTDNVDGYAQLWLRIDDSAGNMLRLVNYPRGTLKGTTPWTWYETSVDLPETAYQIRFGFLLFGSGKAWGDDLALLVDGQPLDKVRHGDRITSPASRDKTEFAKGSGIELKDLDEVQVKNLALLGMTWGFLKYYHPFIAGGNLNWDYELFRFLPSYIPIRDKAARNLALLQWINKWGPPPPCKKCSDKELKEALHRPDLDWLRDSSELGADLSTALQYIRDNRHQGKGYYMDLEKGVGNPRILHEDPYESMTAPDGGYRLLSLFRYWNLIQYWFPYKHLIGEDWKKVLPEFIPQMAEATDATRYAVACRRMIARVHDTHANVWGVNKYLDSLKGNFFPPVKIIFIGERPVVSKFYQKELAEASGLQPGDVIVSIQGKPVADIIRETLPDLPASNYATQLRDLAGYLLRGRDSLCPLRILRDGQELDRVLVRGNSQQVTARYGFDFPYQRDSSFFFIEPGIGYINLGKVKLKQVDSIFHALEGSRGLIIDNRQYPGEFPIYAIGEWLLPEKKLFTRIPAASLDYPGAFSIHSELYVGKKNKEYYKGKVVILVNENSQSSAEFHAMAFRQAPGAVVLGSSTAGADGNVSGFYLPGKIYTLFSGIGILTPEYEETQRIGIRPDIIVTPTVQGIREKRDELVERAVQEIKK